MQIISPLNKGYDPYQDNVQALFNFNNNANNTGSVGSIIGTEGNFWNAYGAAAYQSKPSGGANTYTTTAKFGTHSFNFGGIRRLHYSNYDAFPMIADFTLEAWVYPTSVATDQYIFGRGDTGSATVGSYLRLNSSGNGVTFWFQNSTIVQTTTTGLFTANNWYHIAVCRSGNTWTVYVNGAVEGSGSNSGTTNPGSQSTLGGDATASAFFSGYIDSFRFTKNVARYSQAFTPSSFEYPDYVPYVAPTGNDPSFANVSLLCHFNGTNGAATYTDSSSNGLTLTRSGSVAGMGLLTTTVPRFGTACLCLNSGYSTTGAGVVLPASSTPLNVGTGDFTLECWIVRNGQNKTSYVMSGGATLFEIQCTTAAGRVALRYNNVTLVTSTNGFITDGYWHHLAVVRSGTTLYLFLDGLLQSTATFSTTLDFSSYIFGRRTSSDTTTTYCGNIDELRITKGVARYTSNYMVPRGEFPNS